MKYLINEGVISYLIGNDEFVIYNSNDDLLMILNNEGQMIWENIEDEEKLAKLISTCGYANECLDIIKALEEKGCIQGVK